MINNNSIFTTSLLNKLLTEIKITNYNVLGVGQHGIAVHDLDSDKVIKFTTSNNEIKIVNLLLNKKFITLPFIYKVGDIDGISYYIRDKFNEIDDDFAEKIDEEIEDINIFFYQKTMDVRKSNTNLIHYFDDKFLDFLNNLKREVFGLGIKNNFDIEGLALNIYLDDNNNLVLVDF